MKNSNLCLGPCHKKMIIFLNLRYLITSVAPDSPTLIYDAVVQSNSVKKCSWKRPVTLLKKRPWHMCFPVNFAKFLRTTFVTEHLCWLLLSLNDKGVSMSLNHIASLIKFISDIKLMLRCAKTICPYCTCEKFLNYT